MTNEHVLLREIAVPISGTCADSPGILKGTVLVYSDPNTVAASTGNTDNVAGIAAQEKITLNGQTKIAFYEEGDFRGIASGNIGLGDPIASWGREGINQVYSVISGNGGSLSENIILGVAKEAASDEETFRYKLAPQTLIDPRA